MARKNDLRSAMRRAAEAPAVDKFARASETLKRRPTGFVNVEPQNESESAPQVDQTTTVAAPAPEKAETATTKAPEIAPTPAPVKKAAAVVAPEKTVAPQKEGREVAPSAISATPLPAGLLGTPRFEEVPLDLIDENPFNARHIYLSEKVAELASSMTKSGQLIPGLAVSNGERRTLIAGHYRRKAAMLAGIKTLRLMVYDDVSVQDLYVLSYKENTEQTQQTPLDNALAWNNLLEKGVFTTEVAIAEAIGMSKANINKTLQILNLEPSVMEIVEQNPLEFPLSVLYELVLLQKSAGAPVSCDMATRVVEFGAGRKEISQARERHEASKGNPTRRRQHENARSYRIWNQDVNIGNIKEWDSGKVVVDVSFADQTEKAKFLETIKTWMASQQNTHAGLAPSTDSDSDSENKV